MRVRVLGVSALLALSVNWCGAQTVDAEAEAAAQATAPASTAGDDGVQVYPTFPAPGLAPETAPPPDTFDPDAIFTGDGSTLTPTDVPANTSGKPATSPAGGPQASSVGDDGTGPEDTVVNESSLYADLGTPHEIQQDGGFRFSYPIKLPEFRGLEPLLSLDYTSLGWSYDSVDNVLARGWLIGGLSVSALAAAPKATRKEKR